MKQLYRSQNDRVIAGVCGGIAEYFSVDPALIRIVWAIFVFFGGTGLLLYILAWLIVPESPVTRSMSTIPENRVSSMDSTPSSPSSMASRTGMQSPPQPTDPGRGLRWGGVLLILFGVYMLVDRLIDINLRAWWPVLLIVFGVALLLRSPAPTSESPTEEHSSSVPGHTTEPASRENSPQDPQ